MGAFGAVGIGDGTGRGGRRSLINQYPLPSPLKTHADTIDALPSWQPGISLPAAIAKKRVTGGGDVSCGKGGG